MSRHLPSRPNLEHLKKQAKSRLDELRDVDPHVQLADAQHAVALEYGFASWAKLKAGVGAARPNLLAGIWTASLATSAPHPMQRAELRIDVAGQVVTIVDTVADASGRVEQRENTIVADSAEHTSPGAHGYSLTARWASDHVLEAVAKKDGREVGRVAYEISNDGQTLTVLATSAAHHGYPASE